MDHPKDASSEEQPIVTYSRGVRNFLRAGTGQSHFVALFSLFSSLLTVGGVLALMISLDLDFQGSTSGGAPDAGETFDPPSHETGAELEIGAENASEPAANASERHVPMMDAFGSAEQWGTFSRVATPLFLVFAMQFALTMLGGIVLSHRLFGPIERIEIFVNELLHGRPKRKLSLREGDRFTKLAASLNTLAARLESQEKSP